MKLGKDDVVPPAGFEPATRALRERCSKTRLSYEGMQTSLVAFDDLQITFVHLAYRSFPSRRTSDVLSSGVQLDPHTRRTVQRPIVTGLDNFVILSHDLTPLRRAARPGFEPGIAWFRPRSVAGYTNRQKPVFSGLLVHGSTGRAAHPKGKTR
jgi:hypothetical protein